MRVALPPEVCVQFAVYSQMSWSSARETGGDAQKQLDALALAEAQGYDAVWLGESGSSRYGPASSVLLGVAALASRTQRFRIGAAVTIRPSFHPLRIAEEVAMLDLMAGGRLDWAVDLGEPASAQDAAAAPCTQRLAVLQEQLDVVKQAWIGLPFSHAGACFHFPTLECFPTPEQQPHPPIWIAASSPETFEWAGAQGHGVLVDGFASIEELETQRAIYLGGAAAGKWTPRFALRRAVHVGDASQCRDELRELQERLGLDLLMSWHDFGDTPPEQAQASQRRFIEEVAPAFR